MKCIKCGRDNKAGAKFCFLCGTKLGLSADDLQGFHYNILPLLMTGILFIILVFLSKYLNY